MSIDLESMSKDELLNLKKDVDRALKTVESRRKAEAQRAAEEAAKQYGFTLNELQARSGKGPKGAPKYRNPDDPTQTWTGRGRRPQWLDAALERGMSITDLEI